MPIYIYALSLTHAYAYFSHICTHTGAHTYTHMPTHMHMHVPFSHTHIHLSLFFSYIHAHTAPPTHTQVTISTYTHKTEMPSRSENRTTPLSRLSSGISGKEMTSSESLRALCSILAVLWGPQMFMPHRVLDFSLRPDLKHLQIVFKARPAPFPACSPSCKVFLPFLPMPGFWGCGGPCMYYPLWQPPATGVGRAWETWLVQLRKWILNLVRFS